MIDTFTPRELRPHRTQILPFTALPLTSRIASRFGWRDFVSSAASVEVVHPSELRSAPPAISLPDDPDRVLSCTGQSSAELERKRLAGGLVEHGPTIIRSYDNALLLDGSIYVGHAFQTIRSTGRRVLPMRNLESIDSAMLCSTNVTDRYFGHWPTDGLPMELLADAVEARPVTLAKRRWLHEAGYRTLLGRVDRPVSAARFSILKVVDDRGLNQNWLSRMERLRRTLADVVDTTGAARQPVFMARGNRTLGRILVNELELTDVLGRQGFVILQPDKADATTVARTLRQASLVVAVEGSAQAHAMLALEPRTPLISIMPPRQLNSIFKPICDALDIVWAFTVADDLGPDRFQQPISRLLRLLDRKDLQPRS